MSFCFIYGSHAIAIFCAVDLVRDYAKMLDIATRIHAALMIYLHTDRDRPMRQFPHVPMNKNRFAFVPCVSISESELSTSPDMAGAF